MYSGVYECRSPKLLPGSVVTLDMCRGCVYCDHPLEGQERERASCSWRGPLVLEDDGRPRLQACASCSKTGLKIQLKVFECQCRARREPPQITALTCRHCRHYTTAGRLELPPASIPAGICLGSCGYPRLIELQIRLLRHFCGSVPILLSDDSPPQHARELQLLAERYDDVTLWPNPERRGHYAGDLRCFWKAIQWGIKRGFQVVAKVSQRMLIHRPNWLQVESQAFLDSGCALASSPCIDSGHDLRLRSEFCLLAVPLWSQRELYQQLDRHQLVNPAEFALWDVIYHNFGGRIHHISWLNIDRYQTSPGTTWHCTHPAQTYTSWAEKFGVGLDQNFTTAGAQTQPDYQRG